MHYGHNRRDNVAKPLVVPSPATQPGFFLAIFPFLLLPREGVLMVSRFCSAKNSWLSATLMVFVLTSTALAWHGLQGDLLMNMNIGQWIWAHRHIPLHNVFTPARYGAP